MGTRIGRGRDGCGRSWRHHRGFGTTTEDRHGALTKEALEVGSIPSWVPITDEWGCYECWADRGVFVPSPYYVTRNSVNLAVCAEHARLAQRDIMAGHGGTISESRQRAVV